ncbi:centrosome and spindle pole-associated protein 1 isoform X2 [Acanthopagrus latus]|uniref:centrosome and spindle pole-associated protein 1 isoform X2 n=1 Tax=Acanthopagrus latus TaxID=8177 RepID=UPI00187BCE08|nr:centrosome and spindle pole-associated protein 1 isoform X2 [Acanthopagrus latus]
MPPAAVVQGMSPNPDQGLGVSLMLGTDYESKKHKLNQELQLDYQHYIAKKKDLKPREPLPQPQGLSLPINEKISAQEKLREERSKEYNLFLQEQAQLKGLRRETPPVTSKPGQVHASDADWISSPASPLPIGTHNNPHPPPREHPRSRRDAATLTESLDNAKRTGTRRPAYQGRRRWQIYQLKEPYSSEEELSTDREEELEFKHRRRRERHSSERDHRANRAPLDTKEVEDLGAGDQNNSELVGKSDPQMPDSMRTAARPRPATSENKAEFATGLMIGAAEERTASQIRKEQYRRELLKQIAEQQINKMRDKKLELRVAATGATDPEKESDRIKQFRAVNRQYGDRWRDVSYKPGVDLEAAGKDLNLRPKEDKPSVDTDQRAGMGKPHMDDSSTSLNLHTGKKTVAAAQDVSLLDYFSEVYHRDFSNTLGDLAIPRVTAAPPPAPPTVANDYKTPHDAAYYYYGTRNPLDGPPEVLQQSGNFHSPHKRPPPLRPAEATDQHRSSPLHFGELPEDKARQRRESALIYQEALRQQIKEREERKRREKEERERYDSKKEAEMMAYNPWGKSGGGAPIKDQKGNLVSDLNQMHRINEESYRNPVSRNGGQMQSVSTRDGDTPRSEARAPLSHQISGFGDQPTPQQLHMQSRYKEDLQRQIEENKRKQEEERERMRAEEEKEEKRLAEQRARMQRGYDEEQRRQEKVKVTSRAEARAPLSHRTSGFGDQPTPQQLHMQSSYKEDLKRQIEENKRKQEEERERMRAEEEKEEKRLAEQRARMQRGYDEEQRRQEKVKLHRLENTKEEKRLREEQEIEKRVSDSSRDGGEKREQLSNEREPSPPIPTLQRRQTNLVAPRPPSVVSQLSSRTERSVSAPHSRQVPVKPPQPQDRQQEVIRELSALRRYLRKEQRQLETQLDQTDRQESRSTPPSRPRGRPRVDAFESQHKRDVRPSTRSPSSAAERVNVEHFREFNRLKYRDTASREEVRHMYPDPPADAQSLDIQQQALLREQQRKIRLMKREEDRDLLEQRLSSHPPRNKPGHYIHRDSNLPSETAFIDFYSGDGCEERIDEQRRLQASAEHRERTAPWRRHDEGVVSINHQQGNGRQDSGDHSSRSEVDVSSLCSALERRVSVDTVATDPWLRPGTSDAAKHSGCGEKPTIRMDTPPWLTHRVT